jgi:hypothetical protein
MLTKKARTCTCNSRGGNMNMVLEGQMKRGLVRSIPHTDHGRVSSHGLRVTLGRSPIVPRWHCIGVSCRTVTRIVCGRQGGKHCRLTRPHRTGHGPGVAAPLAHSVERLVGRWRRPRHGRRSPCATSSSAGSPEPHTEPRTTLQPASRSTQRFLGDRSARRQPSNGKVGRVLPVCH